jgi:hypothetical protein
VGAPIAVPRTANPSEAVVAELHGRYCAALRDLFNAHRAAHAPDLKADIEFVN